MIIPSIDIMGGRAVQLELGRRLRLDCGVPARCLELFSRMGETAVIDLDAAMGRGDNRKLIARLVSRGRCRVGGGIRDFEAARFWLDSGARRIIIGTAAESGLLSRLPRDRIVVALDAFRGEVVVNGWKKATGRSVESRLREVAPYADGVMVTFVENEGLESGLDLERTEKLARACGELGLKLTVAGGVRDARCIAGADRAGADAQVGMALHDGRLGVAEAVAATLVSDRPDGLWPTVVCDQDGRALGLAWSDLASLEEALRTGRGVYHSRSRGGRWLKGEISGAVQELIAVDIDCDRDTLRFTVRQCGAGFCHLKTRTCWGAESGLGALDRTLVRRLQWAPPDSYTARLFGDLALLNNKLVEEAAELAAAEGVAEVVHEAADLIFFSLVAARARGVGLAELNREFDRRALAFTRRGGEAKNGGGT